LDVLVAFVVGDGDRSGLAENLTIEDLDVAEGAESGFLQGRLVFIGFFFGAALDVFELGFFSLGAGGKLNLGITGRGGAGEDDDASAGDGFDFPFRGDARGEWERRERDALFGAAD